MTWEALAQPAKQARSQGGGFDVSNKFGILEITGNDRATFLNNLVTIDIPSLKNGHVRESLILTPQAIILFRLWILNFPSRILIILPRKNIKGLMDFFEKRIFLEEVTLTPLNISIYYFEKCLPESFRTLSLPPMTGRETHNRVCIRLDLSGDSGYLLWGIAPPDSLIELEIFSLLIYEGMHPHLIKNGLPDKVAVMELPDWEKFFTFDKGCYPGQEIIIRSRSRNQTPARKYVPFKWIINSQKYSNSPQALIQNISQDNFKPITLKTENLTFPILGKVVSSSYSPKLNAWISWGHLHKNFSIPGQRFPVFIELGERKNCEQKYKVEIEILDPHKHTAKDRSGFQENLEIGLTAYHQNDFSTAKEHFLRAADIGPSHPDPWEALAVIEEKSGNIDSAIRLNKTFAEKNPDSPLAKTNLSRLYMLKGWIEKAEEEKRKATVLMFKAASREKKLRDAEVKSSHPQSDIKNKMRIFQQVLEIDPEDEIAHFGLGKLLFEEKNYLQAEEHFRKTLAKNPSYSLAYAFLADCLFHKGKGHEHEAVSLLKTGIENAQKQGQMIPLKAMEETLRRLSEKPPDQ